MLTPAPERAEAPPSAFGTPPARRDAAWFTALRALEFARLDATGEVYLDYTGSALYPESLIHHHLDLLATSVFGNPHSHSIASLRSTEIIEDARQLTLQFFAANPGDYEVIFTANASGALRLVGEAFPFRRGSRLVLSADNHNSVNGIRELALAREADVQYLRLDDELRIAGEDRLLTRARGPSLFAFPGQSNFSGVQHPLGMMDAAQRAGYAVLLDAAGLVPTNPLRLDVVHPEFVAVSFYKMFGYPTGVGALIARRDALARLERPWFAGGTVEFASVQHRTHLLKAGAEAFEDGTLNFASIAAVPAGLDWLGSIGMDNVKRHVARLTTLLLAELGSLRHANGRSMVHVYGPADHRDRGGTVAFNVTDQWGRIVPYTQVEERALAGGVSVRGGCFCNPGAAERAFEFPPAESAACMERARREGFSIAAFAECLGGRVAVGAVRASLGVASTETDVARLIGILVTAA